MIICIPKERAMRAILVMLSVFFVFFSQPAMANCLIFNENERLSNFCLMEKATGKFVDENTATTILNRLKREGYFGGLEKPEINTTFYPDVDYSTNINGGNPSKPLVIGDLEFIGDPSLIKQEGIIVRPTFEADGRMTFDSGRYLNSKLFGSYSFSPKHQNGFSNLNWENCFLNKLNNLNSIDICGSIINLHKELAESTTKGFSISISDLNLNEYFGHQERKLTISYLDYTHYNQNQFALSQDNIHKTNLFSSTRLRVGQPVADTLALKYGLDLSLSKIWNKRKISINFTHELNDGGSLLGAKRTDVINKAFISGTISSGLSIRLGYTDKNSSIDYYDTRYPSIKLTYLW
jgi:hypothetical protein